MKTQIRSVLLASTLLTIAAPAWAQTNPAAECVPDETTNCDQAEDNGEVLVTGSRIARPEVDSPVPVTVIDRTQILQDGAANVSDFINELPQVGIGSTRTNTNFLTSGTGIATVNLRALGSSRTLTLVNGRRFIGGFAGDSSVDLNNIPIDMIERTEIITGGSSAVYGSDAIAGVLNFILARSSASEGPPVRRAPQGTYAPQGQYQLVSDTGVARPILAGGSSTFSFNPDNSLAIIPRLGTPGYGFNRNGSRYIATPLERYLVNGVFNYDVADGMKVYAEGTYARVGATSRIEAYPLDLLNDIYFRDVDPYGIPITNAFIPAPIAAAIAAANSDGDPNNDVASIGGRRRQNDVFNRSNQVQRDTWRAVLGVRGDLGSNINYDVSYVYGHVKDFNASEDIDNNRYRNALDALRVGPGNVVGVDIVCRDVAARADGCIPINLFGFNTADPRASAYVQAVVPKSETITNEQHVFTASVSSSSLFDLWGAGGVGAAVGVEYRYDSTFDDLDVLTNTGGNSGNQIPDLRGNQDVYEVFGELNVPLISNKGGFEYLGLTGAARYSDYSTIGSVFSWNAGAEWEPVQGVRFRGRYAVSNRAPNNSELFSAPSETFAAVTDPCDGITATSTGETDAACRAIPGIANFFAANPGGTFQYTLADTQGVNGFTGGNQNLQEETARTITAGVVLTPRALRGFSFSVDYYDIKIDDAINSVGRSYTVEQCLLTNTPVYCDNVIRFPTGILQTVNSQLINIAGYQSRGFDAQLRYATPLGLAGDDQLSLNINYTYVLDFKTQSDPSSEPVENAGTFGAAYSTHRASARATYGFAGAAISWQTTFLSGGPYLRDTFISNDPEVVALNDIKDYWLHNVQLSQNVGEDFTFYLNVDNVFDTKPQYLPGTPFGTPTGLETTDNFDVFGRRFTAGFRAKF
ncbi:TonB-dependent receptor plug domain-containing protein [Sphingomonas sp. S2-65]|uniref:TonB-dependent receptor plug domain-containing protein n=1 Tax=Sphingomonas sp. S2-65 TaxID=2903960 RepID=UPI001F44170D|nr:TonB-dependent receptor [Sphingomonas sp. S2-65]UYY57842.1 TonB-dependent receptor [Sphingomonas sp. S2-65]